MTGCIYCDICHNCFFEFESHDVNVYDIKKAYREHLHSDECRKVAMPVSHVELDFF